MKKKKKLDILLMTLKVFLVIFIKNRLKLNISMPLLREQFQKSLFEGSNFENVLFWESNFENATFKGAILKMSFLRKQFWWCNFWGSNFENVLFGRAILKMSFLREQFW